MKRLSKRIIALFVTMAMCVSLAAPCFALSTDSMLYKFLNSTFVSSTSPLANVLRNNLCWDDATTGSPSASVPNTGCSNSYVYNTTSSSSSTTTTSYKAINTTNNTWYNPVTNNYTTYTVIGKANKCKCLLVLTDRANHQELTARLYSRSAAEVVKALRRIRRKYPDRQIKTLTCDNGCEFADVAGMEQIAPVYFCHPYSSWERGSNECANKIIRRFLPKGKSMDALTEKQADYITRWMNHYPRKSLGWQRPENCMTA